MRKYGRVDGNQREIVQAFRQVGCSVALTHELGDGFPDLVIGKADRNGRRRALLVEIKDGSLPPSKRALTPEEAEFHAQWRGPIAIVHSVEEALALLKKEGLL